MRLIGLMGPAGSGKSTIAKYLESEYGFARKSFAEPLKRLAMATLDFSYNQCFGTQEQKETVDPRYGFSPRWFLQRLGTNGCRAVFGAGFWTDQALAMVNTDTVFEDVRFPNEAQKIIDMGGQVWKVRCDKPASNVDSTHPSEQGWKNASFTHEIISVIGDLDSLHEAIDLFMFLSGKEK